MLLDSDSAGESSSGFSALSILSMSWYPSVSSLTYLSVDPLSNELSKLLCCLEIVRLIESVYL